MNDKILTLFSALLLAAAIGLMSWHDMHPRTEAPGKDAGIVIGYYAGSDATAAMVPDDSLPLTIAQGEFKYAAAGKTRFVRQGMTPATFAQRQVNLALRFNALPKKPEETLAKIKELIASWGRQGTVITIIFLDYRPPNPDFKAYAAFIRAFKKSFLLNPHVLIPVADFSWFDERQKAGRQLLREEVPLFLLELPKPELPAQELQKLRSAGDGFQIRLPAGALNSAMLKKTGLFRGAILTLSPQQPILKQEPKVGVFPKFIESMKHDAQSR